MTKYKQKGKVMDLKGSKTEKNLQEAFIGESKARNKYTYFAKKAEKEGYIHIAKIFEETAGNEKEHAKIWFKLLNGGDISDTLENLKSSAETEHYEWTIMYKKFEEEAKEEGFEEIAFLFGKIQEIEKMHDKRYRQLYEDLINHKVFEKEEEIIWQCSKCGYTHKGKKAPEKCPFCSHPKAYFEEKLQ